MASGSRWSVATAVGLLVGYLLSGDTLHAQSKPASNAPAASSPKRTIEVYRGTVRTDARGNRLVTPAEIRRATERVRLARKRAEQQLQALVEQTSGLAEQSFDSFSRGLMPLPDHLEQLKLSQRAELLAARDEKQIAEIQMRHIERLDAVVGALRAFDQPNAQGWEADLLLAQTLAADARSKLAAHQKRDAAAEAARQQAVALADAHLQRRQADSTIGWATVPMLVNARLVVQQVRQDEPYTQLPADEFLEDAVTLTRSWQERDAGIGRVDRLALAQYQQARFALRHGLELDTNQIGRLYMSAEAAALQLYNQQREFLRTGTASLYDVARAWSFREELGSILSLADLSPPLASEEQMLRDLGALQAFARDVQDRQGRIEADLSYINVLGSRQQTLRVLDDLDDAEAELKKLQPPPKETSTEGTAPASDAPATSTRKPGR
jgi:hypothetical protein